MRCAKLAAIFLIVALFVAGAGHARADIIPFYSFQGAVTSFQVITAPDTYTDGMPSLPTLSLTGNFGFNQNVRPPYCMDLVGDGSQCDSLSGICDAIGFASIVGRRLRTRSELDDVRPLSAYLLGRAAAAEPDGRHHHWRDRQL